MNVSFFNNNDVTAALTGFLLLLSYELYGLYMRVSLPLAGLYRRPSCVYPGTSPQPGFAGLLLFLRMSEVIVSRKIS